MHIKRIPHRKVYIMKWIEVIKINVAENRRVLCEKSKIRCKYNCRKRPRQACTDQVY
jgi:hypothetical protein